MPARQSHFGGEKGRDIGKKRANRPYLLGIVMSTKILDCRSSGLFKR
ncbi:MAG: hypothetical protein ACE5KZ_07945 [Candidatus Scalinduaceae bacterium]